MLCCVVLGYSHCCSLAPETNTRPEGMSREPSLKQLKASAGNGRWFDALTISLGQTSKGRWYASTLELQLASFETCVACRSVRTLRVTVYKAMPLSLWDDDDPQGLSIRPPGVRRLPGLQAAGVAWKMRPDMFVPILSESRLLREVDWMQMGGLNRICPGTVSCWGDIPLPRMHLVHSPRSYFKAMLIFRSQNSRSHSVRRLGSIPWSPALRQLSLGWNSDDDDMDWEGLPDSLERLALGGHFNQPIESATWPVSLKRLTLGGGFNRRITKQAVWPASLLQLTFGNDFNRQITSVAWPASLLQLTFGRRFNQPIIDVVWPVSLLKLAFGSAFDQPIAAVQWPASLIQLAFGHHFNQPVADVVWPACLETLIFDGCFDQPIAEVVWPASLTRLDLWGSFNLPIESISWPSGLLSLTFGFKFNQRVQRVVWPASLKWLEFGKSFMQPIDDVVWPPSLQLRIHGEGFDRTNNRVDWPPGIDMFDYPTNRCTFML